MWETFRRFGLEHCDLSTMLDNVADLLRIMALNIDGREEGIPIIFIILSMTTMVIYFYVFMFSMIWFVFWLDTEDLAADMVVFSAGMSAFMSVGKLLCLHFNSDLVKKTTAAYLTCDKREPRDSRMYRNRLQHLRVVKRRAVFIWLMIVTNGTFYCLRPHVRPGRHLIEDAQILYGLEPLCESPNFELTLALVTIAVSMGVYACASITSLLIIVVGYLEAQMLALSEELLHLWDDAQTLIIEHTPPNIENKLKNEYIKIQLESIIETHAANLTLLHLIESIFSNSIAIEFVLLGMGLIAQLLCGLENTYLEMPYALIQVSIDCITGQRLIDASLKFRNAVYACQWENFDVSNMRTILVILQNSRTMELSAGGITPLGYISLMSILRSIYSTYTGLRSIMN